MFYYTTFLLLFFTHYLDAFYIKLPSMERDKRIDLTINLIERCSRDVKASFFITDLLTNSLCRNFHACMTESNILLDKSENYNIPMNQKTPVPWIILVITSPKKVEDILMNATWRDFNQYFIILDGGDSKNGCVNAQSFLMEAWKRDILNAVFICWHHKKLNPQLYSFNPFTDFAPRSWNKISEIPAINNHSWTLFSRSYDMDDPVCQQIFFEKTNNLGGCNVRVNILNVPPFVSYKITNGKLSFEGYDYEIIKLLTNNLNATLISDDKIAEVIGSFDNKTGSGLLSKLAAGKIDLVMYSPFLRDTFKNAELIYPFQQTGIFVITQQRKFKKISGQLFSFLPLSITTLFFTTSILIFILLRYIFKDPYSKNLIDILRISLNFPIPTSTVTLSGNIVFGITLVTFMISNIVIQSYLNTVLTSKNIARNVENIQDLIDLKYNVYARPTTGSVIKRAGIKNVKSVSEHLNCSQLGENDAFTGKEMALRTLITETCHISKNPLISGIYSSYYTRRNWPIYSKINKKLKMLFEGGLTDNQVEKSLKKYKQSKPQEPNQYQVISMDHMKPIFYVYIVLTSISSIVFFIELSFARLL